ncbi:hypothetical protein M5K25_026842 [Dendrobium thyrsiflorum]|uniref:Uncharacterized protein n=1 Tax=Dendrobium thyrsiflorum TaxID=117978 RepID=A0ABD0TYG9_DENTH
MLDGWKAKLFSFASRLQFVRFSIWNSIAYLIKDSILPKSCCKFIDKFCARFLFHGDTQGKKLHLISLKKKKTSLSKKNGGLGLPSISALTHAYFATLIWLISGKVSAY